MNLASFAAGLGILAAGGLIGTAAILACELGQLGHGVQVAKKTPAKPAGRTPQELDKLEERAKSPTNTGGDYRAILHEIASLHREDADNWRCRFALIHIARNADLEVWKGCQWRARVLLHNTSERDLPRTDPSTAALVEWTFPRLFEMDQAARVFSANKSPQNASALFHSILQCASSGAIREIAYRLDETLLDDMEAAMPAERRGRCNDIVSRIIAIKHGTDPDRAISAEPALFNVHKDARCIEHAIVRPRVLSPVSAVEIVRGLEEHPDSFEVIVRLTLKARSRLLKAFPSDRRAEFGVVLALSRSAYGAASSDPELKRLLVESFVQDHEHVGALRNAAENNSGEFSATLTRFVNAFRVAAENPEDCIRDFHPTPALFRSLIDVLSNDPEPFTRGVVQTLLRRMRPAELSRPAAWPPGMFSELFCDQLLILERLQVELSRDDREPGDVGTVQSILADADEIAFLHVVSGLNDVEKNRLMALLIAPGSMKRTDLTSSLISLLRPREAELIHRNVRAALDLVLERDPVEAEVDFSKHGKLGLDDPRPEHLRQTFGTCYLAAWLAAIAHRDPHFLREMIREDPHRPGRVQVRLVANAQGLVPYTKWCDVDLVFPAWVDPRNPERVMGLKALARHREGEETVVWGAAIEKAFALNVRGDYEKAGRGGDPADALGTLVASPGERESITDLTPDVIANRLRTLINEGKIIIAHRSTLLHVTSVLEISHDDTILVFNTGPGEYEKMSPELFAVRYEYLMHGDLRSLAAAERNAIGLPIATAGALVLALALAGYVFAHFRRGSRETSVADAG